jgi:hypothetical protein
MDNRQAGLKGARNIWAYLLLGVLFFSCGCATTKSTASGFLATAKDAGSSMKKDAAAFARFIQASDSWMREKLW